jgi:hypothetical protein
MEGALGPPTRRPLADETEQAHVLMNNCYSDYAQRNATKLIDLLAEEADEDRY